ncbi:MAG TPA: sulfatase [Thermomicrobiales bacterium]|nr:sulfatase [Thermomicrobiales bacterium]
MSEHRRPNILFIMSDDHAAHAISAYGSQVNETPQIDRIGNEGVRLDNCFCTNSICAPSRATILTGTHNHINGVLTLADDLDGRQENVAKLLQGEGYQTSIFGKWHLGHGGDADPAGFDRWVVLPGQGDYHDPHFYDQGELVHRDGYVTDLITEYALGWLEDRDHERPFMMMLHHKAPHRPWQPDEKHASMYEDLDIPLPETFDDDYENRSNAARNAEMRIESNLYDTDLKKPVPDGLSPRDEKIWKYQRYMKDYLRCIASVDDNVGRVLDYLDEDGVADDTIVIYTSDQGFFLGDHGWYDKRFMYEESLRMPFLMRYPREIPAGTVVDAIVTNVDFAPMFLDYAGQAPTERMQGLSFRSIVAGGDVPEDWPEAMYYRYWMHLTDHYVPAHYGVRTTTHKLIYYYGQALGTSASIDEPTEPEWELFDLEADPQEMRSVYGDPAYAQIQRELADLMYRLQSDAGDKPAPGDAVATELGYL